MSNTSKYDLLSNVIAFIIAPDYDASITNLSHDCNVPIQYMRETMLSVLNNHVLRSCIYVEDDYDAENTIMELLMDSPEETQLAIRSGRYDETIWEIDLKILNYDENNLLPLSPIEYGTLNSFGEDILSIRQGALFEKKETINPISDRDRKNQQELINARDNKKMVSFDYKDRDGNIANVKCFPTDIFVNVTDNWIYMRSSDSNTYRLDRIIHKVHPEKTSNTIEYAPNPNTKYVWGTYFDATLEPVHVKIKIAPETKNIMNKIKNDLRFRSHHDTYRFYQDGNYFYYEDDLIGLNEFQRWVRGYGSSIVVIEPIDMRIEIIKRAKETLDNYEKSLQWKIE